MRRWATCLLALAVLSLPALVVASESILSYDSDIRINGDATMVVRETIRVRAEGEQDPARHLSRLSDHVS